MDGKNSTAKVYFKQLYKVIESLLDDEDSIAEVYVT